VRPAVFLDRDGTIIEQVHHLIDPAKVRLLPDASAAIARLRALGYACVVVTNQSVIGRGLLDEPGLTAIHAELDRQLAAEGAAVDGYYFCPEQPRQADPAVIEHPDRKPGPGMLQRASRELGLSLASSWMIGDALSDVLAGRNAGCKGSILVRTGYGRRTEAGLDAAHCVVDDLAAAVQYIIRADDKT